MVDPDGSGDGPSLGTLVAQVELRAADSALAGSLGWEDGVPGARVRILRNGTAEWFTIETDNAGSAEFRGLEPGIYFTYAVRVLNQEEAGDAGGLVRGLGGGKLVRVSADTVEETYRLRASHRNGLVISEVSGAAPPPWEVPGGSGGTEGNRYFEVYNQSKQTLYLDGRVFGTWPGLFCHGCANTCELGASVRNDSTGIYTRWLLAFPGSGTDHAIRPGQVRLVAGAAQDHRELHEDMLDLRDADFEIGAPRFADNPSVPNMVDIGATPFPLGQLLPGDLTFLAEPFDPSTLERPWRDIRGNLYMRVPLSLVSDVAFSRLIWPERDAEHLPCDPIIHPNIEGFPGGFPESSEPNVTRSFQREVLTTEDGIPILMDTNTSAADFEMMLYTPGDLPL